MDRADGAAHGKSGDGSGRANWVNSGATGEPLGHILFDGPPGLGKTTFATCIPRELGVNCQIASGANLAAPKDAVPYLTNAEERSVFFIDEIHRMSQAVEEFL